MSTNGSLHLPDLPKLFVLEEQIIGWHDLPLHQWLDNTADVKEEEIARWRAVLAHERVRSQVLRSTPSFPAPSPNDQRQLEQATAAINVPPAENGQYNITQIRQDADWLSKQLQISQIEALRVVLLEWRDRPHLHLLAGYSEPELASLKDIYKESLAFDAALESALFRQRDDEEFQSDTARNRRQVFVYFQECLGLMRTWLALQDETLAHKLGVASNEGANDSFPNLEGSLEDCVDLLARLLNALQKSPKWDIVDEDTNGLWSIGHLYQIKFTLQIVIVAVRRVNIVTNSCVGKYFKAMGDVLYLSGLQPEPLFQAQDISILYNLVAIATVAFIDPSKSIEVLRHDPSQHWMSDLNLVPEIHANLLNATENQCIQAVPAAFAWALVLQQVRLDAIEAKDRRDIPLVQRATDTYDSATGRRSSMPSSASPSIYEDIIDNVVFASKLPDPITVILRYSLEGLRIGDQLAQMVALTDSDIMYSTRIAIQGCLQEVIYVATVLLPDNERYSETVLRPQFALLTSLDSNDCDFSIAKRSCQTFINNEELVQNIFEAAECRFPYEPLPYLRLCRLLAQDDTMIDGVNFVIHRLQNLRTLTQTVDASTNPYHTVHEEENADRVILDAHTWAVPQTAVKYITSGRQNANALIIPAGTNGRMVSTDEPVVVCWDFAYSAFALLGDWLARYRDGTLSQALSQPDLQDQIAAEAILLLANLLTSMSSSTPTDSRHKDIHEQLLSDTSHSLGPDSDITSLIFDVLEQQLQLYRRRPTSSFDTGVLVSCMEFAKATLAIAPSRFWQLTATTSLFASQGESSFLFALISGVETPTGDLNVTKASATIYRNLVIAALRETLTTDSPLAWRSRDHSRFATSINKAVEKIVYGFTQVMLRVYESAHEWCGSDQALRILSDLSDTFRLVTRYRYGVGNADSQLTMNLSSSATLIYQRLRPDSSSSSAPGPIMRQFLPSTHSIPSFSTHLQRRNMEHSLLSLSQTLLEIAQSRGSELSSMEMHLLDLLPVVVRRLKDQSAPVLTMLNTLLTRLTGICPVSLLGHLGTNSCLDFVNVTVVLLRHDQPQIAALTWQLLTTLVGKDQQWLSVVLLSGKIPVKAAFNNKNDTNAERPTYRGHLVLDQALDALEHIKEEMQTSAGRTCMISILHFVIMAQQNWASALSNIQSRPGCFAAIAAFPASMAEEDDVSTQILTRRIAALSTDLASVYLQYARAVPDHALTNSIMPLITWLTLNAIEVSNYNTTLHSQLSKNFQTAFSAPLVDFKSTRLGSSPATSHYYDVDLLDLLLARSRRWGISSMTTSNGQTYRSEVVRANANLSQLETDIVLLQSFKNLCLENAAWLRRENSPRSRLANIAQRCLKANAIAFAAEQVFEELRLSRTEMALALIQYLLAQKSSGTEVLELLQPALESALARCSSYDSAIASNDLHYWRTALSTALMALQFHVKTNPQSLSRTLDKADREAMKQAFDITPQIIEIATLVIGEGLKTIVHNLQETRQAELQGQLKATDTSITVGIKDVSLVLCALETIMRMARLPEFANQLTARLLTTDTIDSAVTLYTWAHLLADDSVNNEPVYADLAVKILVSLSKLNGLAENMAIQGVFNILLTARVTQVLQQVPGGVSCLDNRPHCRSLYTIWSTGILPLTLNVLSAVRGPVAAEISLFLNSFPQQLAKASLAFQPQTGGCITSELVTEACSLSLVSYMLDDYRTAGASAAVDSSTIAVLTGFDEHKKALAGDLRSYLDMDKEVLTHKIVAINQKEVSLLQPLKLDFASGLRRELQNAVTLLEATLEGLLGTRLDDQD